MSELETAAWKDAEFASSLPRKVARNSIPPLPSHQIWGCLHHITKSQEDQLEPKL